MLALGWRLKRKWLWSGACDSAWLSLVIISRPKVWGFSVSIRRRCNRFSVSYKISAVAKANMVVNDLLSQQGPWREWVDKCTKCQSKLLFCRLTSIKATLDWVSDSVNKCHFIDDILRLDMTMKISARFRQSSFRTCNGNPPQTCGHGSILACWLVMSRQGTLICFFFWFETIMSCERMTFVTWTNQQNLCNNVEKEWLLTSNHGVCSPWPVGLFGPIHPKWTPTWKHVTLNERHGIWICKQILWMLGPLNRCSQAVRSTMPDSPAQSAGIWSPLLLHLYCTEKGQLVHVNSWAVEYSASSQPSHEK